MPNIVKTCAFLCAAGAALVGTPLVSAQPGTLQSPSSVEAYFLPYGGFSVPIVFTGNDVNLTNATGAYVLLVWDGASVEADTTVWSGYRIRRSIPGISGRTITAGPAVGQGDVVGQFKARDRVTSLCISEHRPCDANFNLFGIGGGFFFKGFSGNRRPDGTYFINYPPAQPGQAPAYVDACPTCRVFLDVGNLSGFTSRYAVTSIDTTSTQYEEFLESDVTQVLEVTPGTPPASNLEHVAVVPNPYKRSAEWDLPGRRGIHFIHLPDGASVRIFTSSLELVRELTLNARANPGGVTGELEWDMRNGNGQEVKTGIYLYQVEAPQGRSRQGHFVIIK